MTMEPKNPVRRIPKIIWTWHLDASSLPVWTNPTDSWPSGNHGALQWVPWLIVTKELQTNPTRAKKSSNRAFNIARRTNLTSVGEIQQAKYPKISRNNFGVNMLVFIPETNLFKYTDVQYILGVPKTKLGRMFAPFFHNNRA